MKKFILLFFINLTCLSFTSVAMEDEGRKESPSKKRTLKDGESDAQSSPKKRKLNADENPEQAPSQNANQEADKSLPSFASFLEQLPPPEENFDTPKMWWTSLIECERLFEYTSKRSQRSPFDTRGTTFYVSETSSRRSEKEIDWSQLSTIQLGTPSFEERRDALIATSNYPTTPHLTRRNAFYEAETGDQTIFTEGFDREKALNSCWYLLPDPQNFQ